MGDLMIGCPIYKRAWAVPRWFEHVHTACEAAKIEPEFAFVMDPNDEETIEAISNEHGVGYGFAVEQRDSHDGTRVWNDARYAWMVELRNELLGVVRLVEPKLFLSLDSDIFLHEQALVNMLESIEGCDAVGGKAYMTEGDRGHPSWAKLTRSGGLHRHDVDGVMPVEVIMAIKLMRPTAYNVNYEFHKQGEDIGWSLACQRAGLNLKFDGRVANKHVITPDRIDLIDKRCGY